MFVFASSRPAASLSFARFAVPVFESLVCHLLLLFLICG
jgi:hypothetical protein